MYTRLHQNILSLWMFSSEVTWPVRTKKYKRIGWSDAVSNQLPVHGCCTKHTEHACRVTEYFDTVCVVLMCRVESVVFRKPVEIFCSETSLGCT